jgi:hypothetical protein
MEESTLFEQITPMMWLMFALGLICVFIYSWKISRESKGIKKYMTLSFPNVAFHIIASFMVFLTLEETGEYFIRQWLTDFKAGELYHLTLSSLSGMFGSAVIALIFELSKRIFKK